MPRAHVTFNALTATLLLAMSAPAIATEACVPTEYNEYIDDGGGSVGFRLPDGHQEECHEDSPGPGNQGGTQHLVAHFPPSTGARELLAVDATSVCQRVGATAWLMQAVATAPDAPPQVIDIGLRQGTEGIVLATRDAKGRIAVSENPLPMIGGDHALISIAFSGDPAAPMLAFGGATGGSLHWPLEAGASVTLLGAARSDAQPAAMSLGQLD